MRYYLFLVIILLSSNSFGQTDNSTKNAEVNPLKISGYLQAQFQKAQSEGINSWSAGDFSDYSDNRFMLRRGRFKVDHTEKYTHLSLQLDATQNGVNLMDAYLDLKAPNVKNFLFTMGLFNRPFGYSIAYSSRDRAFPERARVFQTLMPRERDLGAMITYTPEINENLDIEANFAVTNGSGINSRDYDSKKDLIGNLKFNFKKLLQDRLNVGIGASIYSGSVRNNTNTYYSSNKNGFVEHINDSYIGKNLERNYYGVNLQLEIKNSFGATTFKTEYVAGQQPGVASSSSITGPQATTSFTTQPQTDLYVRNFNGYFFWLTQQIAKSKFNVIVGYDVYDPNKDIKNSEIGTAPSSTAADIKFNTLGYGVTYAFNEKIRFTLYNENVKNKGTNLTDFRNDLKDDVFTARILYRW